MTQSSMRCDSYVKALVEPQAQMMFGHRGINIKMVNCPDCGKEFTSTKTMITAPQIVRAVQIMKMTMTVYGVV